MLRVSRCCKSAEMISGVGISNELKRRIKMEVDLLERPPCLAVLLVGEREDSLRYVKHKKIAADACGIKFVPITLSADISQQQLNHEIIRVGNAGDIDAVLLQLPLPPHLSARQALFMINPSKDVDGLHPLNFGNLFLQDRRPLAAALSNADKSEEGDTVVDDLLVDNHDDGTFKRVSWRSHERRYFIPCTALAVRTLLFSHLNRKYHFFSTNVHPHQSQKASLRTVIVNKSMVVGIPTSALLLKEGHFNVTLCSRSDSLDDIRRLTKDADVLITAYGSPKVFDASFVKKGAIVVDVAINSAEPNSTSPHTTRICGDMDVESVSGVASAITSVPGGVGPLTVAHLMQNVVKAYHLRRSNKSTFSKLYECFLNVNSTEVTREFPANGSNSDGSHSNDEEDSNDNSFEV
ncbi:methylenetetrahydrofolate dehydrogenase (NADP+) [Angomonas deanei]|uniref:Tetrahydrofolate dehydrogenase/cyclohydrolase, catalytic domain/Tetrahydrofolate dehydrogenase/cyclohydrolase, NAD(P)-binding domain containing protein, putative n=1 Tax=Angomonas deanei TaxID=59799 RepID=A0A7G2CEM5_9TRYP|nr:methylenetetrahydrofolate dehydrogenase (NADP+) [Angomonas deanei]CAD2218348.1 Tetrahydrofolate dehydrogenase/cyclohydrolase, catalytic domain/Tetrahydrofolate dehydrogenase/cyclohydrolase, NAD(P)-binding domain containing protein, putative [Angomonas deanei]|eukprot:EPY41279.1 methylenetetrahydrofolate dehydrogenase (NADP+) [Angomonas deanei]